MKKITTITLSVAVAATLFLSGCNDTEAAKPQVAQPSVSETSLGLRKTDLYTEEDRKSVV